MSDISPVVERDLAYVYADRLRQLENIEVAARRALDHLTLPHKHDWRPDLIQCANEQDAIGILRSVLITPDEPDAA
jgi:hypothetical protein